MGFSRLTGSVIGGKAVVAEIQPENIQRTVFDHIEIYSRLFAPQRKNDRSRNKPLLHLSAFCNGFLGQLPIDKVFDSSVGIERDQVMDRLHRIAVGNNLAVAHQIIIIIAQRGNQHFIPSRYRLTSITPFIM